MVNGILRAAAFRSSQLFRTRRIAAASSVVCSAGVAVVRWPGAAGKPSRGESPVW